MDTRDATLLIFGFCMFVLASAAGAEPTTTPRVGANGAELPSVVGQQRFQAMLPLVRDKLGSHTGGIQITNFRCEKEQGAWTG